MIAHLRLRLVRTLLAAAALATGLSGVATAKERDPVEAPADEGSPTLGRVMTLAKQNAPAVLVARAEINVARSAYAGARLPPLGNPYLEVVANRGMMGATKDVSLQGTLFMPIEFTGQRGKRIAEADALVALSEAGLDAARAGVLAEAVRAFGAAAVASARVRTFEGIVAVSKAEAEVYKARLDAGDATEQDEKLAKLELARNTVLLEEAKADVTRALTDLARLTAARWSAAPDASLAEPPALPAPPPATPADKLAANKSPLVLIPAKEAELHARIRDRHKAEAWPPFSLLLQAGRGDMGEARFGGGIGFTFPLARANQAEIAKAEADKARALLERDVRTRVIAVTLAGLAAERAQVKKALAELNTAEPAAQAALDAAIATLRAGKGEALRVLTARRDLALLKVRRLDLYLREWGILSEIVALTGVLP